MSYNFSDYYSVDPWANITTNERPWYDPLLRDWYRRASVYSQWANFKIDLNGPKARTIYFNDYIPPRPNIAPISARQQEATRLYTDAYQKSVTTARYGNGMSLHRESEMFNYWQNAGGGMGPGLRGIIDGSLGQVLADHLDALARNAFLKHPAPARGLNSASSFATLSTSTDKVSTGLLDQVWLDMRDTRKPFSATAMSGLVGNEIVCITTPGVVHDLKTEVGTGTGGLNFVEAYKYQNGNNLITGELGMYRGVRFVENQYAKLWNAGAITHQTTIKAAVVPGQGAPDPTTTKVDGVYMVGQPGATHFITVQDASGFSVGQRVTVHKLRHTSGTLTSSDYNGAGVVNGVIYDDPMAQEMVIYSIDTSGGAGAHKIAFTEPYMMTQDNGKGLETDLGSGVYGYVTLGQTVHSMLFLNPGWQGLVAGVAQSPVLYTPRPIDDYESIYRVAYDFWLKYAIWDPRAYRLVFLTGANAEMGRGLFR